MAMINQIMMPALRLILREERYVKQDVRADDHDSGEELGKRFRLYDLSGCREGISRYGGQIIEALSKIMKMTPRTK